MHDWDQESLVVAHRSEDQFWLMFKTVLTLRFLSHYVQWRMFSKPPDGTLTCTGLNTQSKLEPAPLEFEGVACSPNFEA